MESKCSHDWVKLKGLKHNYSKCYKCGWMRHDLDGDIFNPKSWNDSLHSAGRAKDKLLGTKEQPLPDWQFTIIVVIIIVLLILMSLKGLN
jgi:hypothetical protein